MCYSLIGFCLKIPALKCFKDKKKIYPIFSMGVVNLPSSRILLPHRAGLCYYKIENKYFSFSCTGK